MFHYHNSMGTWQGDFSFQRWPVVYFGSNPGTAHQLYNVFWQCVNMVGDRNVHVDYIMTDGASTNRKCAGMLFSHPETPRTSDFVFSDTLFPQHNIICIQDMMHCLKNIRNNIELCKLQRKTNAGRCLFLENNYVVWKHWAESFNYNRFSIYRKSTESHQHLRWEMNWPYRYSIRTCCTQWRPTNPP